MKHPWGYLLLSVALHVSAGWLLHALRPAPEPLAFQPPMAIQLVSLAPAAQPLPAAPARPQPMPRPVQAPAQPKAATPAKPAPTLAKAVPIKSPAVPVKSAPPRSETRPSPSPSAVAAAAAQPTPSPSAPARIASAPAPVAAPATPVVSLRPSFISPPPPPRYPSQARRRNQQGIVRVEVCLDERGQQLKLTLVRSSGVASLDQAALEAVTTWRFRPEIVDGRAVPSRVEIPIEFALTANR
ncbi:energy transducer TonB [Pseudomonas sp. H9]|uniref:energy transducer TonB n=1 Tax=Pseudomonas sp. H9 TaxID=483968 RepID=UPI001057ACAF|nr:energy transducer TonB [Pseudomonas sp. H9]TDF86229.1 energy transducer TonB [Pseudomonas sp. H9]